MLNSDDRRPAFDRWFTNLDAAEQTVVVHAAMEQRDFLQDAQEGPVSLIDCLENIWDEVTEHGIQCLTIRLPKPLR
jgi:hypothetical protein